MKTKISQLVVSPFNVRNIDDLIHQNLDVDFDESIDLLAKDIKENGLINKIVLTEGVSGNLEIVAGSRRCKALEQIHGPSYILSEEEYVVRDLSNLESLKISISENQQRYNLTSLELVNAVRKIEEVSPGVTEETLCNMLGLTPAKLKRIINLEGDIKEGKVPEKALKELSKKESEKPKLDDKSWEKMREEDADVVKNVVDEVVDQEVPSHKVGKVVKEKRQEAEEAQAESMKFQGGASKEEDLNAKIEYAHKGVLKLVEEDSKYKLFCVDKKKQDEEKIDMRAYLEYLRHPGKYRCEVTFRMKVIPLEI